VQPRTPSRRNVVAARISAGQSLLGIPVRRPAGAGAGPERRAVRRPAGPRTHGAGGSGSPRRRVPQSVRGPSRAPRRRVGRGAAPVSNGSGPDASPRRGTLRCPRPRVRSPDVWHAIARIGALSTLAASHVASPAHRLALGMSPLASSAAASSASVTTACGSPTRRSRASACMSRSTAEVGLASRDRGHRGWPELWRCHARRPVLP
jgi:hypothetical protein